MAILYSSFYLSLVIIPMNGIGFYALYRIYTVSINSSQFYFYTGRQIKSVLKFGSLSRETATDENFSEFTVGVLYFLVIKPRGVYDFFGF